MDVSHVRLCVSALESPDNWPDSNYSKRNIHHTSNNSLIQVYTNSYITFGVGYTSPEK